MRSTTTTSGQDEKRNVGLGPEHDWSSHAADAFGYMAIAYEEPPVKSTGIRRPSPAAHRQPLGGLNHASRVTSFPNFPPDNTERHMLDSYHVRVSTNSIGKLQRGYRRASEEQSIIKDFRLAH